MTARMIFTPTEIGSVTVPHRIVMAPLTRFRATQDHVPTDILTTYYSQRSTFPGTLIITEGTIIAQEAGGYPQAPGIWSKGQISAWKDVTEKVHENGSYIYLQIFALGRQAVESSLESEGVEMVSSGDIPIHEGGIKPRPLTKDEILKYVEYFRQATLNAVEAGFDGVEVHAANGYLIEQFIQSVSNNRTDEYGGSVENRLLFFKQVLNAVVEVIGEKRTGVRISPFGTYGGMGDREPFPTLVEYLKDQHPNLAYLHLITPRADGAGDSDVKNTKRGDSELYGLIRKVWAPRPLILAGGYKLVSAEEELENSKDENLLIAFGRYFISNPDLIDRIKDKVEFSKYDRDTFYTHGPEGYIDYPTYANIIPN